MVKPKDDSSNFERWSDAIKNMDLPKRPPMWDQAIKFLVSEGAMGPTVYDTLSQGQIQEMILDSSDSMTYNIFELFVDIGLWIKSGVSPGFYITKGNELWLAYLMTTGYAKEWDGENWVNITDSEGE